MPSPKTKPAESSKTRFEYVIEELIVDVLITVAIVWGLVALGEPLLHVLTSPLFIILTVAGLGHLTFKALQHDQDLP